MSTTGETTESPQLIGHKSKMLAPMISAFNHNKTLSTLFSNNNQDISEVIELADPTTFPELTDDEWQAQVRLELQIINAFLRNSLNLNQYSTTRLEQLLDLRRLSKPGTEWSLYELFIVLSKVPQFEKYFSQYAKGRNTSLSLMPLAVTDQNTSLQTAIDSIFWRKYLSRNFKFNVDEIPVIENPSDVFFVSCPNSVKLESPLWLERYTKNYLEHVQAYWHKRKDFIEEKLDLRSSVDELTEFNGNPLMPVLETAAGELEGEAGQDLRNLITKLQTTVESQTSKLQMVTEQQKIHSEATVVPINPLNQTPWGLSVLFSDNAGEPLFVYKSGDKFKKSTGETVELDDILNASIGGRYVAMFEKNKSYFKQAKDQENNVQEIANEEVESNVVAPSVLKVMEQQKPTEDLIDLK